MELLGDSELPGRRSARSLRDAGGWSALPVVGVSTVFEGRRLV